MGELDELKSKITYDNKTIFGIVGIIVGFLFWGIGHPGIGIGDVLILIFPCILLIIPSPTIKNSKVLSVISIIILLLLLLVGLSSLSEILIYYLPDSYMFADGYVESMLLSDILQLILCIYGLFCAFLLSIQSEPNQTKNVVSSTNYNMSNNATKNFDKYCTECGQGLMNDAKFCPGCGRNLNANDNEPATEENMTVEEEDELKCKKCGAELTEESIFCPECGEKIKDNTE
ncbi:zinc ribbon domain-containing protein [uncultured Methanobrevibacter sp.]|uniref:zinc ribbon domain-containing protein n=1 Tax=uncultured Methanobrevibacter sp. TaxID=253161 RepID=UPI0025DA0DA2|nr:zinc ribbon domain-containing protein [uncultured Methanobrevibacter sp.]